LPPEEKNETADANHDDGDGVDFSDISF